RITTDSRNGPGPGPLLFCQGSSWVRRIALKISAPSTAAAPASPHRAHSHNGISRAPQAASLNGLLDLSCHIPCVPGVRELSALVAQGVLAGVPVARVLATGSGSGTGLLVRRAGEVAGQRQ